MSFMWRGAVRVFIWKKWALSMAQEIEILKLLPKKAISLGIPSKNNYEIASRSSCTHTLPMELFWALFSANAGWNDGHSHWCSSHNKLYQCSHIHYDFWQVAVVVERLCVGVEKCTEDMDAYFQELALNETSDKEAVQASDTKNIIKGLKLAVIFSGLKSKEETLEKKESYWSS